MSKARNLPDVVVDKAALRRALLAWYDRNARALPWRAPPGAGEGADPYRVWLSEVMLQQTTVAAVKPYYEAFLARWPSLAALAAAPREAVLEAWAGLGYYSRARNLHACAQAAAMLGGFPDTEDALRALPGIGPYTAAAVAAIAFGAPANVVDGNIERVMARLFAVEAALPQAKPQLAALAGRLVSEERPGDWAQALMDLGATVCTPRRPRCGDCPLAPWCLAKASAPETYPRRAPKPVRPQRFGAAFVALKEEAVWAAARPDGGLLGGMLGPPTTDWRAAPWSQPEALAAAPGAGPWRLAGAVRHVFTHFALSLDVYAGPASGPGGWTRLAALPSVFRKAARAALNFAADGESRGGNNRSG